MDKQIKEMALIICGFKDCTSCISRMGLRKCGAKAYAERLTKQGYRKASEVAREFIELVDKMMESITAIADGSLTYFNKFAELKKKYESEGEE